MAINEDKEFENRVIRLARIRFPNADEGGSIMIDGKERDGIFITKEAVHYIECTTSKSKSKARQDCGKLNSLKNKLESKFDRPAWLWFITKHEPTADQRAVARSFTNRIKAVSMVTFTSKIVDASKYLLLRANYPFGSVRDPETNNIVPSSEYIPIELADLGNRSEIWNTSKIKKGLEIGNRYTILGQYGVGKSMSLRDIYNRLSESYVRGQSNRFPLFINLRDHDGQVDPVEVIERHARGIGYSSANEIVQAWRGGFITLILDGFDELATIGWASKIQRLESIRYRSMEIVRRFIVDSPKDIGIVLAGRSNYFDSFNELKKALNLDRSFINTSIDDFQHEQVQKYLQNHDVSSEIPEWIPTRPLLLGYLIAKKVINNLPQSNDSPAIGWNMLIDEISKREADIDAGVSPENIRNILEKLASKARSFTSSLGPISDDDMAKTFEEIVGYKPDDRGLNIIQRLPGLGFSNEDGARYFIDENFASAAKAGEVSRYVIDPFNHSFGFDISDWGQTIEPIGLQVLHFQIIECYGCSKGKWETAIEKAYESSNQILALDIYLSCREFFGGWSGNRIQFENMQIPFFEIIKDINESKISFKSVYFSTIDATDDIIIAESSTFEECLFENVIGFQNDQIPTEVFIDCVFDEFEENDFTTSTLLELDLPVPVKVSYTILKKIYIQKGGGRQLSALLRGLDHQEKRYVNDVLKCLNKQGYATVSNSKSRQIWLPIREKKSEVLSIIGSKNLNHPLVKQLAKI